LIRDQDSASTTAPASKPPADNETLQLYELTLKITIKELCRQVAVQCTERGALLHFLFEQLFSLLQKQKDHATRRIAALPRKYEKEVENLRSAYIDNK
jgi:hypothetical protein